MIGLREIVALLCRDWRWIFGIAAIPLILAALLYLRATPIFEGTASMLVLNGREFDAASDADPGAGPSSTKQEIMNSELEILNSRDIATRALREIGPARLFPDVSAGSAGGEVADDRLLGRFQRAMTATQVKSSNVILLSFEHPDRATAVATLDAVIHAFRDKHADVFSRSLTGVLDSQLAALQEELAKVDREIERFKIENKIFAIADERKQLLESRTKTAQELSQVTSRLSELQARIDSLNRAQRSTEPTVTLYSESEPTDVLSRAKTELLELEVKQKQLGQSVGDRHPAMLALESQIARTRAFIAQNQGNTNGRVRRGRNALYDELNTDIARSQVEISAQQVRQQSLSAELDRITQRLTDLERAEPVLARLQRQHDTLETTMRASAQRMERVRVNSDPSDSRRTLSISVIQSPSARVDPVRPKLSHFLAIGLGLGLLAGCAAIALLFAFKSTFICPEAVEASVDIPVLVSLPLRQAA